MKNLQRKLPLPMTEQDKTFMRNLLAGVRAKREAATAQKKNTGEMSLFTGNRTKRRQ